MRCAGPQRSRLLATLYKDDRTRALPTFSVLEATFLERMIRPAEVAKFAATLLEHHKALTADGT